MEWSVFYAYFDSQKVLLILARKILDHNNLEIRLKKLHCVIKMVGNQQVIRSPIESVGWLTTWNATYDKK